MRLSTLAIATQLAVALLLLSLGLTAIVVLEEAADTVAVIERPPEDDSLDAAESRLGGAIGFVAILAGVGLFAFLLLGAWGQRHVAAPVRSLQAAVAAIADGHVQRRADEGGMIGELQALSADVNRITDRLRQLERARATDVLLTRAALEALFDATDAGGAVLDPTGRLVAANARVRDLLDRHGCPPSALLGRDADGPALGAQVEEVRDGGILRGYVARTG